jgi:hypothetical protein
MRTLLAAIALALAAAGCGDGEDRVEGSGYSYQVPEGWEDVSDEAEDEPSLEFGGLRPDSLVVGEREEGLAPNVAVVRESGVPPGVAAREYVEASIAGLRDPVAAGLPPDLVEVIEEMRPRQISRTRTLDLAGEEAVELELTESKDGRVLRVRQVVAVRGGSGYSVALTAARERFEDELGALDEVVESWRWN